MDKVRYLIVGQGIAGSLLALELEKAGQQVLVLNHETPNTSSNKAGGVYNPITGRKMVKTWMADLLFPYLSSYYPPLETQLGARFYYPKPIYRPFISHEEQNDWAGRASDPEFAPFIKNLHTRSRNIAGMIDPFGGLELNHSGYVDLPAMLLAIRKYLQNKGMYRNEVFKYSEVISEENRILYREIEADYLLFCEGPMVDQNPFWNHLPFKHVKGETLEIDAELPEDFILNRGVFILPKNGHYTVGATYNHRELDYVPSEAGINELKERLAKVYQGSYSEVQQLAGVRPATFDRRPFIGFHPDHPQIGIFNGFGTKGVSLIPYFANQMVNYLLGVGNLIPEVQTRRLTK